MTTPPSPAPASGASGLREGLAVIAVGVRAQPRPFVVSVLGSALYGVMTVLTAWAVGAVVRDVVTPAVAARTVTAGQLW
ncbi:MAG TPA: hypothetical protein VHM65_03280, partial [Candidatus Lustribacter sp.]|nr:hypothetical protein [Candidatus Lustribacter sp.]